jgi:hypothetical protein
MANPQNSYPRSKLRGFTECCPTGTGLPEYCTRASVLCGILWMLSHSSLQQVGGCSGGAVKSFKKWHGESGWRICRSNSFKYFNERITSGIPAFAMLQRLRNADWQVVQANACRHGQTVKASHPGKAALNHTALDPPVSPSVTPHPDRRSWVSHQAPALHGVYCPPRVGR